MSTASHACLHASPRCRADRRCGLVQGQAGQERHARDLPPVRLCRHRQDHARPHLAAGSTARSCTRPSPASACVMRSKGCRGASTIHRLIYKPPETKEEQPSFGSGARRRHRMPAHHHRRMLDGRRRAGARPDVVQCAAAGARRSRAAADPRRRLLHGSEPNAILTETHRQAQDDPIVRLSMDIRAGKSLAEGQ